jgi:hypothetical protein
MERTYKMKCGRHCRCVGGAGAKIMCKLLLDGGMKSLADTFPTT